MVEKDEKPQVTESKDHSEQNVTIPAETLQRILAQLDKQDKVILEQGEQVKILRESVNAGRLSEAENKRKPDELPKAYLKVFMGKIVVGWKTAKTEMLYHPSNPDVPVGEILKAVYTFEDGSDSGITDQVLFTRCEDRVIIRLLDGKEALKNPNLTELKIRYEEFISSDEALRAVFVLPIGEHVINRNFINP